MKLKIAALAFLAVLAAGVITRAEDAPKKPQRIEASAGEVTQKGEIKGEESLEYVISAQVGQSLSIVLEASNRSAHFDVVGPGSETPFYVGAVSGDRFQQNVRENGDHLVRVYIVRRAARKGESASYSIAFKLSPATQ